MRTHYASEFGRSFAVRTGRCGPVFDIHNHSHCRKREKIRIKNKRTIALARHNSNTLYCYSAHFHVRHQSSQCVASGLSQLISDDRKCVSTSGPVFDRSHMEWMRPKSSECINYSYWAHIDRAIGRFHAVMWDMKTRLYAEIPSIGGIKRSLLHWIPLTLLSLHSHVRFASKYQSKNAIFFFRLNLCLSSSIHLSWDEAIRFVCARRKEKILRNKPVAFQSWMKKKVYNVSFSHWFTCCWRCKVRNMLAISKMMLVVANSS